MESLGGFSAGVERRMWMYLYSQYNSNLQYAYTVRTFRVRQIFLVEDANLKKNPIFLCQSKSFCVQRVCQDWCGGKGCFLPAAQARSATKPLNPQRAVKVLEGDASTGGAGTCAEVSAEQGAGTARELTEGDPQANPADDSLCTVLVPGKPHCVFSKPILFLSATSSSSSLFRL